jgi:hypothetical protein
MPEVPAERQKGVHDVTTDRWQEKARGLVEAGNVFPIPGLRDTGSC